MAVRLQTSWLKDFLAGGTSALLLSLVRILPHWWPLSLVALVPFLGRVTRGSTVSAVRTGCLLGASCILASLCPGQTNLWLIVCSLPASCCVFALFAWVVNRLSQRIGINAVLLALLWLPMEWLLQHLVAVSSIDLPFQPPVLSGIASLFGTLIVSFLIVLVNVLAVGLLSQITRWRWSRGTIHTREPRPSYHPQSILHSISSCYPPSMTRGPPCSFLFPCIESSNTC